MPSAGVEPALLSLEGICFIQLSYEGSPTSDFIGASDEQATLSPALLILPKPECNESEEGTYEGKSA